VKKLDGFTWVDIVAIAWIAFCIMALFVLGGSVPS